MPSPALLTKPQFAQMIGVGITTAHRLIQSGEVKSVRIGTAVRVPVGEVDAFVERLLGDGTTALGPGRAHGTPAP